MHASNPSHEYPLTGKIALVTGASRGAGRGIAIELAAAGASAFVTGRSRRGQLAREYGFRDIDGLQPPAFELLPEDLRD